LWCFLTAVNFSAISRDCLLVQDPWNGFDATGGAGLPNPMPALILRARQAVRMPAAIMPALAVAEAALVAQTGPLAGRRVRTADGLVKLGRPA
jgi:hypothetical protein